MEEKAYIDAPQSNINKGLESLQTVLNELGDFQDHLAGRLDGVLRPQDQAPASTAIGILAAQPVQSSLAYRVTVMSEQANKILRNFRDMATRLEL